MSTEYGATSYAARTSSYVQYPARPVPPPKDDYERWYTEERPNNRMLLSLRSGIPTEVRWALDRLCRLSHNEKFSLRSYPGLTDALFEWPERFISGYDEDKADLDNLFVASQDRQGLRRNALESLFILRNASVHEVNALELHGHAHTRPLLAQTLQKIKPTSDVDVEYLIHAIDILYAIFTVPSSQPPSRSHNFGPAILHILRYTSHRSLIITCLTTLDIIMSNHGNSFQVSPDSPALTAALHYLPLFSDKPLLNASLNYLYAHLSYSSMVKAFLLHPGMPSVLRLLVSLLISEQAEETVTHTIGEPATTVPATVATTKVHELTEAEFNELLPKPEPQRCYEWMKIMFVAKSDGELTQVDFWNLYKDAFIPHAESYPLLVASDVIKNVNVVFPQAQAMVLPGPPQRFVVRGVARQTEDEDVRFKCLWNRSQCPVETFNSPGELYEHLLEHIATADEDASCQWSSCAVQLPRPNLHTHVLTHVRSSQPPARHPLQGDFVTLPTQSATHPIPDPTTRPPPPTQAVVSYRQPIGEPLSTSLTALLCIRLLYHSSFASVDAAPRLDVDHFGFPGLVEEDDGDHTQRVVVTTEKELEGEMRGRRAFASTRNLLEEVKLRDDTMMGWIREMLDTDVLAVH
ncbi:hypothetical protein PUNSTDRAFT_56613 [Punctularia strigosozonata HHB-11173 SS5]|uniref:uncharacterized protein n=1 Tax=Punctularia strigosozonata (strain HHB-11173) TaxID=741275 RepID=UPI0004416EDA|nr:uncharacterized protein PUNSTDRAFT_56613 [Punctularia strigosozonata HHB-11173 SS5]EIN13967.1 hypothetical protein PUNSTDRAFT_56613 [Punctularia strigosozonata HHB-11173 SS5]